jgi:hypothetical protein
MPATVSHIQRFRSLPCISSSPLATDSVPFPPFRLSLPASRQVRRAGSPFCPFPASCACAGQFAEHRARAAQAVRICAFVLLPFWPRSTQGGAARTRGARVSFFRPRARAGAPHISTLPSPLGRRLRRCDGMAGSAVRGPRLRPHASTSPLRSSASLSPLATSGPDFLRDRMFLLETAISPRCMK